MAVAGGYAMFRPAPQAPASADPTPPSRQPNSTPESTTPRAEALPPGHPPVGASGAQAPRMPPPSDEAASLTWTIPDGWQSAPNPSNMRLATYKVAHVGSDTEDAELSISRAGGNVDANIQRWVGQFEGAGKDTRANKTIKGLKVTTVEVSGTFMAGSMGGASAKKPGWSLLGAIVETPGSSYFFKMTGPTATIQSAKAGFAKMIDSISPK